MSAARQASSAVTTPIESARTAQTLWREAPIRERLSILRALRIQLASEEPSAGAAAAAAVRKRPLVEILSTELLPLLDACRFLERRAASILKARRLGPIGRPLWLAGTRARVSREPHGTILIIAPSNYPLFLPGVQILQALAAGNAVLVKPAPGATAPMTALAEALARAGLPPHLLSILPEDPALVRETLAAGVAKVILTGSAATGRALLDACAAHLTPATMELSGCDSLFVRKDADPAAVARAIRFGLTLNAGRTCIAPRRIFVHEDLAEELRAHLRRLPFETSSAPVSTHLAIEVKRALDAGARLLAGTIGIEKGSLESPLILADVPPGSALLREDFFAAVASIVSVRNDEEALALDKHCPYALGASIFGSDLEACARLAEKIDAGFVTINDLIAPTADPRLPFGGRGESGSGSTRGIEGLLEMTVPKALVTRKADASRPHFKPLSPAHETLFRSYLILGHGRGFKNRLDALRTLMQSLKKISPTLKIGRQND